MRPALIAPVITQLVADGRELLRALIESEQAAQVRRMEMGRFLLKARGLLPKRGSRADGWCQFLEAIELDETTAFRYMKVAEACVGFTVKDSDKIPSYADLGLTKRIGPELPDAPPPTDGDAPREADDEESTDVDEVEIDRDTWCTPKWITDAIGEFDLDPCANERSHVQATKYFELDARGEDGLVLAADTPRKSRVFINPPYSDVMPWIEAYKHTRFCFLLKLDPSTKWFEALLEHTGEILLPRGTRIQFEAPDGVPPDKSKANQFPHALFYAYGDDADDAIRKLCFPPWRIR
jgi:phage N-6-adenine-methyltransferase